MKSIVDALIETYKYMKNKKILVGYPARDDIARGRIGGARQAQIEGFITGIVNGARDISELGVNTIPTPPLSGITMQVVSTSANDTLLGSGARKVIIEYIEPTTEVLKSVEVELNGTTPVTIPVSIAFVSDFYVSDNANFAETASGDITIFNGGTVYNIIKAGGNKSLQCYRYVPKNKNLYITSFDVSGSTKGISVRLRANQTDNLTTVKSFLFRSIAVMAESPTELTFNPPMVITGGHYIKASVYSTVTDNQGIVSAGLNGWLEDKEEGTLN